MIDKRFSLVPHSEYQHLYYLRFSVNLPPNYATRSQTDLIIAEAQKQYPELVFSFAGGFSAKFPDGQYARQSLILTTANWYVTLLNFSLPLQLDTIMSAVCGFKKAVPPIEYMVEPYEFLDFTPDDFYEQLENLYDVRHKLSLRIRAVTWKFIKLDSNIPVYSVQPTDYDYI